jgi:hypothetical protein
MLANEEVKKKVEYLLELKKMLAKEYLLELKVCYLLE